MRSVTNWPEIESAVQTTPATAITKNIPVVPETPKRSSTTEETMMVSIVMPEIGLRAVVAIAFAATEVKKNEKSRVSPRPTRTASERLAEGREEDAGGERREHDPDQDRHDREVAVGALRSRGPRPGGTSAAAIENDPAMMRSDFRMPKMPAVAIAPTPM